MKVDRTALLVHMCEVVERYQYFMEDVRYGGNKYDDPIWKRNNKNGSFGFVPTPGLVGLANVLKTVHSYLEERRENKNFSFLDAGCGVGNILLIACVIGFNVHGIELDAKTVRVAKKLLANAARFEDPCIIRADLTKYSKYKSYDVIYYFQPMKSDYMQKFLHLLSENMKIGSIVIVNGTNPFKSDKRFKSIIRPAQLTKIDGVYEKRR